MLHKAGGGSSHSLETTLHSIQQTPSTINSHNTELQMVMVYINNTEHIKIASIYIPPRDSTYTHYKRADTYIQHITNIPHSVFTGDVNAHSNLWHSYTDDHRGQLIADVISNSYHINTNYKQTNQSAKHHTNNTHIHQISPRCLTRYTIGHCGQLSTHYHLTTPTHHHHNQHTT